MTDIYEKIGQKIKILRTTYPGGALNQEELAKKLKIPANTLSRWETGKYKPKVENLDHLARFFGVPITVFIPSIKIEDPRMDALASATGGLNDKDFEEVIRYAEFRKVRKSLEEAKG
jgi:transcriptional regulator with XRE-family HTH domain